MNHRGLLVTFEGLDGSGKTTQIEYFTRHLINNGLPFVLLREPGGTVIGEKIRAILLDKTHSSMQAFSELLLYSASRHQLTLEKIKPALQAGQVVICDRFYDSTTAYQGYARGLDAAFIRQLNRAVTESLVPDLTIVLDISLEERQRRMADRALDRLENEIDSFHRKVRQGFLQIAEEEPRRVKILDGHRVPEILADEIWQLFLALKEDRK